MIRAAVLGSPISHSLSPLLHRCAYQLLGVQADYSAIEMTPERAPNFFQRAIDEDWTGFSLTMPLKETIFDYEFEPAFVIDPVAVQMRSANTLIKKEKTFWATSTDRSGFVRLFENIEKKRVAIIGGGGTARAALSALDGKAGSVDFLLRTQSRSELLSTIARSTTLRFFGMDHPLLEYDLVISTVPSGVTDLIAANLSHQIPTLCEVLYRPFPTALLSRAQSLGSHIIDGIDLLVEQALDQIALFSSTKFDFAQMRVELQAEGRKHLLPELR